MNLSPARSALAEHINARKKLMVEVERARGPFLELRDRIGAANADLRAAESTLTQIHQAEADHIVKHGSLPAKSSSEIGKAETEVSRCRRVINALEGALLDAERPLRDRELSAQVHGSGLESLLAGVVTEAAGDLFDKLRAAQTQVAEIEAAFRALIRACVMRRWMPLAEKLAIRINTASLICWEDQKQLPDWDCFIEDLATGADVPVPA